eukprot:3076292-Rhodomonas_salina.1
MPVSRTEFSGVSVCARAGREHWDTCCGTWRVEAAEPLPRGRVHDDHVLLPADGEPPTIRAACVSTGLCLAPA